MGDCLGFQACDDSPRPQPPLLSLLLSLDPLSFSWPSPPMTISSHRHSSHPPLLLSIPFTTFLSPSWLTIPIILLPSVVFFPYFMSLFHYYHCSLLTSHYHLSHLTCRHLSLLWSYPIPLRTPITLSGFLLSLKVTRSAPLTFPDFLLQPTILTLASCWSFPHCLLLPFFAAPLSSCSPFLIFRLTLAFTSCHSHISFSFPLFLLSSPLFNLLSFFQQPTTGPLPWS